MLNFHFVTIKIIFFEFFYKKNLDNENPRTRELAPPPNYESAFENISETGNDFTNDRLPTYEEALKL